MTQSRSPQPAERPELIAPGGSLLAAHYAFEAGADGVYLGLQEFSARKGATNFSPEQLRRIRGEAASRGKRIYVAVNTVVKERELDRLAESLAWVEALGIDGVIVQDLGVAELCRRHFPRLALHASTQMAVHNSSGIRVLGDLGFARVILARELTLDRIRALREEHPDIELEVFVHGALCYSVSGLCFASWALTGRSGNRGECAQICRSRFRVEGTDRPAGLPADGHLFSCRDLAADSLVVELADIGVDALKIEGRMKSPEYVSTTVALYRRLLDRGADAPDLDGLRRRQRLTFSRRTTRGYMDEGRGEGHLLDAEWPGHRGVPIGKAAAVRPGSLTIALEGELALRDGLQYFPAGQPGEPVQFAAKGLRRGPGSQVIVELPADAPPPRAGQTIFRISARSLDLKEIAEGSLPLYRIPCECDISLAAGRLSVAWTCALWREPVRFEAQLAAEPARGGGSLAAVLERLFAEAGESPLRPARVAVSGLEGGDRQFAPPSLLKRLKNDAYRALERRLAAWLAERVAAAAADARPGAPSPGPRARGHLLLPLEPLAVDDDAARRRLEAEVDRLLAEDPERRVAVGLANISHLDWVPALAERPRVDFFIDYPLYVANRYAFAFYQARVPRLLFQRFWVEGDEEAYEALASALGPGAALERADPAFELPLFTSLGCFVRNNSPLGPRACDRCPRDFTLRLSQGRNRFVLRVRDCVTRLYRDRATAGPQRPAPGGPA